MSNLIAAYVGDEHVSPIPGHGSSPIILISGNPRLIPGVATNPRGSWILQWLERRMTRASLRQQTAEQRPSRIFAPGRPQRSGRGRNLLCWHGPCAVDINGNRKVLFEELNKKLHDRKEWIAGSQQLQLLGFTL